MAHPHASERSHERAKAHKLVGRTGYARGGSVHSDAAEDARMIERGVGQHEAHDHPGKPKTKLHLGDGVEGEKGRHHLAKRARGGSTGKKHGSTKVNVIVAPQGGGGGPPGMASPIAAPPRPIMPPQAAPGGPPPGMMPPRPPMAMPPGGGMGPPGAGMMRKRGGKIGKRRAEGGAADDDGFPPNPHNLLKWVPDSSVKPSGTVAPAEGILQNKQPKPMSTRLGRSGGGMIPEEAGSGSGIGRIDKVREYGTGRGFKPAKVPMEARGR